MSEEKRDIDVWKLTRAELLVKLCQAIQGIKGCSDSYASLSSAFQELSLKCATKAYQILEKD